MSVKPMPVATSISQPFWQALNEGELLIQQCEDCRGFVFYPRNHCTHCMSDKLSWKPVSGEATLYTYTLTRVPTLPELADEMPQALAVVELKEGVRVNTTLTGLDESEIRVGMKLKPVFHKVDARGNTLLRFTAEHKALDMIPYNNPFESLNRNAKGQIQVPISNLAAMSALANNEFTDWSEAITVDQALINAFADLSGDNYWIHTDPDKAAKESPFGTTIAHGSLVQVLQSRMQFALPFEVVGFKTMVNYGSNRLRFPAPVPAGSQIHARAKVKAVDATPKGMQLTLEVNIHVVGQERPSVINDLVIFYR
ncbi:OB-fold domain-containing protein [Shewanella submarina]|uniref:MaoC/PaaZ C-terminal domain-containing protein n=1 Tax=Shewanella submarina TaxID=2016376 RepID=A0ABV7GH31_9GAMM|nr:MaoC/PaaZ C-terminal domain-containing protein [Shewanella submarina]MCL1037966.1 OB-fold domain-containing protein [Shewanella submarina]